MLKRPSVFDFFHADLIQASSLIFDSPYIKQYEIPPQWGSGSFYTLSFGTGAGILVSDCSLCQSPLYTIKDPSLLHICYFDEIHCSPQGSHPLMADTFYCKKGLWSSFQGIYQKNTPIRGVHIFLTQEYCSNYLSGYFPDFHLSLKKAITLLNGQKHLPDLACIFHQFHQYNCTAPSAPLFYYSKLNELLARIIQHAYEAESVPHRTVRQTDYLMIQSIAEYICTHLAEDTSLDSLSHIACMSPAKLKYTFKAVFDCSIREFRLKKRIEVAETLLCSTDCGMYEIACRLGYQNAGSFSEIFKKYMGISPKAYRSLHKPSCIKLQQPSD